MKRLHLFEIEDQPWFPASLRAAMTEFLDFMGSVSPRLYRGFIERLGPAMAATGDTHLVDLCSGGGGPSLVVAKLLGALMAAPVTITLTDLYPNLRRFKVAEAAAAPEARVAFSAEPVDATSVPASLTGFRLLCNGFHHFRPDGARRILRDAVDRRRGIAVLEATERSVAGIIGILLGLIALVVVTPVLKPFRLSRIVFTYVIPIIPLCVLWDGIVSCLRIYSPPELRALIASLPPNDYVWDTGILPVAGTPAKLTYLIGRPPAI